MEDGTFKFTDEENRKKFIEDKERDIKHYKKLIERTEELLSRV